MTAKSINLVLIWEPNQKDVEHLFKGAEVTNEYDNDPIDSSYYLAITPFSVLKVTCYFNNLKLREVRIGIQGLGKVGLKLLQLASEHGMKLVTASTQHGALYSSEGLDVNRIFDLSKKHGDKFISYYDGAEKIGLEEFFEKDMDIMCPCADIYLINKGNIEQIKAKIIVSGCNVAATEKIEKQLHERRITYLPGFVCNAGGVLGYLALFLILMLSTSLLNQILQMTLKVRPQKYAKYLDLLYG